MNKTKLITAALSIALFSLIAAPSAEALSIRLSQDGGTTYYATVNDNGVGDFNPLAGEIQGVVAGVTFTVVGVAGSNLGTPVAPYMLFDVDPTNFTAGALTAELTDVGFGPSDTGMIAFLDFNQQGALPAGVTASYSAYYDGGNAAFAQSVLLTPVPLTTDSSVLVNLPSGAAPYSLTQVVTITHPVGGAATRVTAGLQAVPDGGLTLGLLGFGLVGVEALRRKFNRR